MLQNQHFIFLVLLATLLGLVESMAAPSRLVIVQNKGGGHGEIGYSLAKLVSSSAKATEVVLLQDASYKPKAEPFCQYPELVSKGVKIQEVKVSDNAALVAALSGMKFDVLIDNNSKDPLAAKALADAASSSGATKYIYISSGGMYTGDAPADGLGYMEACCKVKEDNDCRKVEVALDDSAMKGRNLSFRPQYIYGKNTNKRGNIDYFIDRIVRGLPVPMPGDGSQKVALTHVEDVVTLLWAASCSAETGVFNAGTDKFITYAGLCEKIGQKLGKIVKFLPYDPKKVNKDLPKPGFPYRPSSFCLNPAKAKAAFKWSIANDISNDIEAWVDQYLALKLGEKEFAEDAAILSLTA